MGRERDFEREALERFEKGLPEAHWTTDWKAPTPSPEPPPEPAAQNGRPPEVEYFIPALGITPEPVEWLLEGWLPRGELAILSGRPGSQKTTLAAAVVADLTRGRAWGGNPGARPGSPVSVLWATSEDSLSRVLVPRLEAAGADLRRVYFAREGFSPVGESGTPRLREFASQVGDLGLVILDPLKSFAAPEDGNSESDVREALVRVTAFANETGVSVLGISHLRKGGAPDSLDALSGSLAWGATARSVWVAGRHPDPDSEGFVLAHSKCNLGPLQDSLRYYGTAPEATPTWSADGFAQTSAGLEFEWLGPCDLTASEITNPKPPAPDSETKLEEVADWLEAKLRTAEGEPKAVASSMLKAQARGMGFPESLLREAVKYTGTQSLRDGRTVLWAPPTYSP